MALKRFGPKWQRLRQVVLARDPYCKHPGCHDPSHDVDHIVPVEQGGKDELVNLQGLCHSHHSSKTASEAQRQSGSFLRIASDRRTTLVCGPPGAGKTSWVQAQLVHGDLVLDVDTLWIALTGGLPWYDKPDALVPFVLAARGGVMLRLQAEHDVRHAWVIEGLPKRSERERRARELRADVVVLETPVSECWRRMERDARRSSKAAAMAVQSERWWAQYEPREGELVVRPGGGGV